MPTQHTIDEKLPILTTLHGLRITTGLTIVTGEEGSGKTLLLRQLANQLNGNALWVDLSLPSFDERTPEEYWQTHQLACPDWNHGLLTDLITALALQEHRSKKVFMLSTGSRRKVALAGLLASGMTLTCLDQPYAALDRRSIHVLQELLQDLAKHPSRGWIVADYEVDPQIPWNAFITLP